MGPTWTTEGRIQLIRITFSLPCSNWTTQVKEAIYHLQIVTKTSNLVIKWMSGVFLPVSKITKPRKSRGLNRRSFVCSAWKLTSNSKDRSNSRLRDKGRGMISPNWWTKRWLTSTNNFTKRWKRKPRIVKFWLEKIELRLLSKRCNSRSLEITKR